MEEIYSFYKIKAISGNKTVVRIATAVGGETVNIFLKVRYSQKQKNL